jgi:adenosine deaminase
MTVSARDLRALPKARLHIHLEGAMRPETLDELCGRYGVARRADTRGRRFDGFDAFLQVFRAASYCIRTKDDLACLILEVAEDAAAQGVWWIEPAFDAERYTVQRDDRSPALFENQADGWRFALSAAEAASRATGVGIGFVSAIDRSRPPEEGLERARVTAALVRGGEHLIRSGMACYGGRHPGIVALGLHGSEPGNPPDPFAHAFQVGAAETGLLSTPHAGEIENGAGEGATSVARAVEALGANRIAHGVLGADDPALVDQLAHRGVCLDVCPSSNLNLGVYRSIEDHPLPRLLGAGVPCSIGSDDPLLFGPDLVDEFILCREKLHMDDTAIAALARHSFAYSGAPAEVKAAGIAAVNAWLDCGA